MAAEHLQTLNGRAVFLLRKGETVQGRDGSYTVIGRIDTGGFAAVYAVRRDEDESVLALKISLDADATAEGALRIRRELTVMKRCAQANAELMPRIEDEGEFAGRPFFVMENLQPLSWSDTEVGLPDTDVKRRDFFALLIECVRVVHAAGFVHCDIKPSNIMERPADHRPLLIDFGSAHPIEACVPGGVKPDWNQVTQPGALAETPGYGADQGNYTIQKDIFALGQVIRDCFEGDVPLSWQHIVIKCISRRSRHRYESLDALASDIEHVDELDVGEMRNRVAIDRERQIARQSAIFKASHLKIGSRRLLLKNRTGVVGDMKLACDSDEYLIRCEDWPVKALDVEGEVELGNDGLLVIQGPGFVKMSVRSTADQEHQARVLLMDGVTLVNEVKCDEKEYNSVRYFVGDACYLNFIYCDFHLPGEAGLEKLVRRDVSCSKSGFVAVDGPNDIAEYVAELKKRRDVSDDALIKARDFFADDEDPKSLSYCFDEEIRRITSDL